MAVCVAKLIGEVGDLLSLTPYNLQQQKTAHHRFIAHHHRHQNRHTTKTTTTNTTAVHSSSSSSTPKSHTHTSDREDEIRNPKWHDLEKKSRKAKGRNSDASASGRNPPRFGPAARTLLQKLCRFSASHRAASSRSAPCKSPPFAPKKAENCEGPHRMITLPVRSLGIWSANCGLRARSQLSSCGAVHLTGCILYSRCRIRKPRIAERSRIRTNQMLR